MSLTDLLDTLGLLLIAAGLGFAAAEVIGPAGIGAAGVVVLVGSYLAQRAPRKRRGGP